MEDKNNMADTGCLALENLGLANHVVLVAHRFPLQKRKVTGSTQNLPEKFVRKPLFLSIWTSSLVRILHGNGWHY